MAETLKARLDLMLEAAELEYASLSGAGDDAIARANWHFSNLWQAVGMIATEVDAHIARGDRPTP